MSKTPHSLPGMRGNHPIAALPRGGSVAWWTRWGEGNQWILRAVRRSQGRR